jgi:hypothetical protein
MMPDEISSGLLQHLTQQVGCASYQPPVPLLGGKNNCVYRLDTDRGEMLLKLYFRHPDDPRDRLGVEFAFLEYLWSVGHRLAPQPLALDRHAGIGLMEFIHGTRIDPTAVGIDEIDQAAQFFLQCNEAKRSPQAQSLPPASEACFSLPEHLALVQRRVDRLQQIGSRDDYDIQAQQFVKEKLGPAWLSVREFIQSKISDSEKALPLLMRVPSPSDFGFHNAIRESSGRLRFIDFEFAGWDDPAKLICDFCNQPDYLISADLATRFSDAVTSTYPSPSALRQRSLLLEPLYQIKWACICLNEFLAWGQSRRQFTRPPSAVSELKISQLNKSRRMLERANESLQQLTKISF